MLSGVTLYVLLACVALLARSLLRAWLRRRRVRDVALALLIVAGCAMVAALSVRWLLLHDTRFVIVAHYTRARASYVRQTIADRMATAATPFILAACAFVVGVCVTAGSLIHAARRPSPEHMS
jgi:hypothetical protein